MKNGQSDSTFPSETANPFPKAFSGCMSKSSDLKNNTLYHAYFSVLQV